MVEPFAKGDTIRINNKHSQHYGMPATVLRQDAFGNLLVNVAGDHRDLWVNGYYVERTDDYHHTLLSMFMAIGITPPEPLTLELSNG